MTTNTNEAMTIHVLYFASLAEAAGRMEERVVVPKQTSLPALYEQLREKYQFNQSCTELRVAINDYFASWSDPINDGDQVVFITPVAGG